MGEDAYLFDWYISQSDAYGFTIQLLFKNPNYISRASSQADAMFVVFSGIEKYVQCEADYAEETGSNGRRVLKGGKGGKGGFGGD